MAYFLGIDSGGSQTTCGVGDEKRVLGRATAASSKVVRVGETAARASLESCIRQACAQAGTEPNKITRTCIGMAGASRENAVEAMRSIVQSLISGEVLAVGDMTIAHHAAFANGPGVIVIAGTGSIAYGKNERGESGRAGGWGPTISDEGSGDWIGRRAITEALRAHDEGVSTKLIANVMEVWRVATRAEIVTMANASPAPEFSRLFPAVTVSAEQGDSLARDILDEAGEVLARLTKTVVRRLWPGTMQASVRTSGGVFLYAPRVGKMFVEALQDDTPGVKVDLEPVDPVLGALAIARKGGAKV